MSNILLPGLAAENCSPPLGISDEAAKYLQSLQVGERVIECGMSGLTGHLGTVYISDKPGPSLGIVCVRWDKQPGEEASMGSSATWGTRRFADAGTFREYAEAKECSGEPGASDGCDKDGFPGGCERAGHTPETCPGFQVGDTIRFPTHHIAAGDLGVIVAMEYWLNDNETVPWDGCGDPPVYHNKNFPSQQVVQGKRFLVRLQSHNPDTVGSTIGGLDGWRERCTQWPHSYPYCTPRDMELVSRPLVKVLNGSGCLGSVLGLDREAKLSCVSDSAAGARKVVSDMKAAACIPLRYPAGGAGNKIRFFAQESSETKVADEITVGFRYWMTTLFGIREGMVTSIDGDTAVVTAGGLEGTLRKKDDGWYDQHVVHNPAALMKVKFTADEEAAKP